MLAAVRALLALAAALAVAGCGSGQSDAPPPSPALWEVSAPDGVRGWLFGTIHALPDGAEWRTERLEQAIAQADVLVVEVADLADAGAGASAFAAVARSPGLPPLLARVPPADRPALSAALDRADLDPRDLGATETWAAALLIANAGRGGDTGNGVDRALLGSGLPTIALEGFGAQFAMFDTLPEADQAVLLSEAARAEGEGVERRQVDAWLRGDLAVLEEEMRTGLLADPELRSVLLTSRNTVWAERVARMLASGRRPFVAVGAGHMAGAEGLPALLAGRGFTVRRVQ